MGILWIDLLEPFEVTLRSSHFSLDSSKSSIWHSRRQLGSSLHGRIFGCVPAYCHQSAGWCCEFSGRIRKATLHWLGVCFRYHRCGRQVSRSKLSLHYLAKASLVVSSRSFVSKYQPVEVSWEQHSSGVSYLLHILPRSQWPLACLFAISQHWVSTDFCFPRSFVVLLRRLRLQRPPSQQWNPSPSALPPTFTN